MNPSFLTNWNYRTRAVAILAGAILAGPALADEAALTSDKDRLSYALGMDLGNQLRRQGVDVDPALFGKALGDALSGGQTLMTPDEARPEIGTLQAQMMRREAEMRMLAPIPTEAGEVAPPGGQAAPAGAQ